ncbi:DUF1648 domain-containing protein [Virgibacillus alimentarius]|uniref:Membrane protein n=1 Tax=Virgibacillus alimentarius TaxID=698769 RepID=A0ABS4S9Z8_9BACI|nr:DUF1648 domain-containing protein [Virgibacillus alimentarius]MBP2257926.1 putative membrane protein [Virgibacillus alimentarius]
MKNRPVLKIKQTPIEKILNIIAFVIFLGSILYILFEWSSMPNEVPGHYNAIGEVDRWGRKGELWIVPFVGLVLWVGLSILEKFPHIHNYSNLTEDNAEQQYKNSRLMLNFLKNEILLIFSYINWKDIQVAKGQAESLGICFLPIFLIIIFGTLIFFVLRSLRLK